MSVRIATAGGIERFSILVLFVCAITTIFCLAIRSRNQITGSKCRISLLYFSGFAVIGGLISSSHEVARIWWAHSAGADIQANPLFSFAAATIQYAAVTGYGLFMAWVLHLRTIKE